MKILLIIFLLLFYYTGCTENKTANELSFREEKENGSYNIEVIGSERLKDIISDRKGRLLFINVWATWCVPCIEEFPDIVKLSNEYQKNSVDFLSLSADFPEEINTKIIPFLKKQNADFPVYVINEKESEQIIRMLSKEWSGALPATFIYDEHSKQQKFLSGLQDYVTFKANVDSILSL